MAAADILVSRAGGCTVAEALNCGLPIVVFDAPRGSERRACELLDKKMAGRLPGKALRRHCHPP